MTAQIEHLTRAQIGEKLAGAREARNMSQLDMAAQLGMTRQFVSLVERGLASPSFDTLQVMLTICGVTISQVLDFRVPDKYTNAADRALHEKLQRVLDNKEPTAIEMVKVVIETAVRGIKARIGKRNGKA